MRDAVPFGQLLTERAAAAPDAPMLTVDGVTISRAAFEEAVNRRARALSAAGVGLGDFVTLALPNGLSFYEHVWATWKLGAIPNPVSHRLPAHEFDAIIALVGPRAIISVDGRKCPGAAVIDGAAQPDLGFSAAPLPAATAPNWKAMTSGGSTGRPKVIVDASPGAWSDTWPTLGQRAGGVTLNSGPLYHNAPFLSGMLGMLSGSHVVELCQFDPEEVLAAIERHKVTWINLVPTMMNRIWRLGDEVRTRYDLSSIEMMWHMGAPCPTWLKRAWIDWLGPDRIFELYAGTERQGRTVITGREWLDHPGSVGRPAGDFQLRIVDELGHDCPAGVVGEIYFLPSAGQGSTYRYLGAEAKALGEWESLGDMGWLDADGYLYIADRRTDLILSGGRNIYPAEIEAALEAHPDVVCAVAIGLPDDDLGQRAHAIVQYRNDPPPSPAALDEHVSERLAGYKRPRSYEFTRDALRDDAGKVRRGALRSQRLP